MLAAIEMVRKRVYDIRMQAMSSEYVGLLTDGSKALLGYKATGHRQHSLAVLSKLGCGLIRCDLVWEMRNQRWLDGLDRVSSSVFGVFSDRWTVPDPFDVSVEAPKLQSPKAPKPHVCCVAPARQESSIHCTLIILGSS